MNVADADLSPTQLSDLRTSTLQAFPWKTRSFVRGREEFRNRVYLGELDGLRALSVLMVISAHMTDQHVWAWLGGGQGVTIFFVLSGYLITSLALREEQESGRVSLTAFAIRRVCRIFPMYYLALAVHIALIEATGWGRSLRQHFWDALPSYLVYYQEFTFAFQTLAQGRRSPFAHSWTLGIEEKFYLVWPVLGFWLWSQKKPTRLIGTSLLFFLLTPTAFVWRLGPVWSDCKLDVLLFPYSQILLGCLIALTLDSSRGWSQLSQLGAKWGTLATTTSFVAIHLLHWPMAARWPELTILYTIAVGALLVSLLTGDGPLHAILRTKFLTTIGKLSYGMYLFHGLGISIAQKLVPPQTSRWDQSVLAFLIACGCTTLIAHALAILVERPCIKQGRAWAKCWKTQPAGLGNRF